MTRSCKGPIHVCSTFSCCFKLTMENEDLLFKCPFFSKWQSTSRRSAYNNTKFNDNKKITGAYKDCVHDHSYKRHNKRKPPSADKPLVIVILDVPDCSASVGSYPLLGPYPLLQRSSSQHESQTFTPSASAMHSFVQPSSLPQSRRNCVTELSF